MPGAKEVGSNEKQKDRRAHSPQDKYSRVANIPVVETSAATDAALGEELPKFSWGGIGPVGAREAFSAVGTGEVAAIDDDDVAPPPGATVATIVGVKVEEASGTAGVGTAVGKDEGAPEPSDGVVAATAGVKVAAKPPTSGVGSYVVSGEDAGAVVPAPPGDDGAGREEGGGAVPDDPVPFTPSSPQPCAIWVSRSARRFSAARKNGDEAK